MNENILCDKISALRRASGMTQEQLAARLGVTYQAVSKWENAQSCPDIMLLPALAEVFQVSIDRLFGREPAPAEEAPPEREPRVIYGALPWEDDGSLYAVLFRGHELLENKPLPPDAAALCEKVELRCDGDVSGDVNSDFSVSVGGQVGGDVDAGQDVTCGDVCGNVDAGSSVTCGGVCGNVDAGSSVTCTGVCGDVDAGTDVNCTGDIGGDADAGRAITCGDVGGDVDAGAGVTCGSVGGDVDAGGSVSCGDVSGDVDAGGSVTCTGGIGGDVRAGRDVRCGVEPEEDEDKPYRISGFSKGNHVIFETGNPEDMGPEINQKINELTSSARDSAKKAGQTAKDISAMVSKYFEDRFK